MKLLQNSCYKITELEENWRLINFDSQKKLLNLIYKEVLGYNNFFFSVFF